MFSKLNVVIPEGQRGLLVRDGSVVEFLAPGRQRRWAFRAELEVEWIDILTGIEAPRPDVEAVLPAAEVTILEVPAFHLALVTRLEQPFRVYGPGRYALWQEEAGFEIELVDLSPLRSAVPPLFRPLAKAGFIDEVVVRPYERVLVYADGELVDVLTAGRFALNIFGRELELMRVDLREQELQVTGQELMTLDKVTLRLNLVLKYRIADPVAAVQATDNLRDALYAEVQLASRAEVAGVTVDALLEGRTALARKLVEIVGARAKEWGVEVVRLEIKDIVLPGEMKTLLNRVIEAEKRAAAQNILRREEVAATRSLANTARLLESNPVLRRLKEVEAYREIADRIDSLTVVVSPKDLQTQLRLGGE